MLLLLERLLIVVLLDRAYCHYVLSRISVVL